MFRDSVLSTCLDESAIDADLVLDVLVGTFSTKYLQLPPTPS